MPITMDKMKEKISDVFNEIPGQALKKAAFSMKTRTAKMVAVEGKGFENKRLDCESLAVKNQVKEN
jgi:hypothetical protein